MSYRRELLARQAKETVYILKFDGHPAWDSVITTISELAVGSQELSDAEIVLSLEGLAHLPLDPPDEPLNPLAVETLELFRDRMLALWIDQPLLRDALYEVAFSVSRTANGLSLTDNGVILVEINHVIEKLLTTLKENVLVKAEVASVLSTIAVVFEATELASSVYRPAVLRLLNRAEVELIVSEMSS